jgi:hypothetical protein
MELKAFWVVMCPESSSTEIQDIWFEATPGNIGYRFLGGLDPRKIIGFYSSPIEARNIADIYLTNYKRHISAITGRDQ